MLQAIGAQFTHNYDIFQENGVISFKDSFKAAEKYVGKNPRILVLPGVFVKPGFHTFRK